MGTGKGREEGLEFDTPILVEVWRTKPYLYDGRAATIKDVLTKYNPDDKHGKTFVVSKQEVDDLAEFILSSIKDLVEKLLHRFSQYKVTE